MCTYLVDDLHIMSYTILFSTFEFHYSSVFTALTVRHLFVDKYYPIRADTALENEWLGRGTL